MEHIIIQNVSNHKKTSTIKYFFFVREMSRFSNVYRFSGMIWWHILGGFIKIACVAQEDRRPILCRSFLFHWGSFGFNLIFLERGVLPQEKTVRLLIISWLPNKKHADLLHERRNYPIYLIFKLRGEMILL